MFQRMVNYTEPSRQAIDPSLAPMLTFDTCGIELYVTENNPKVLNSIIRKLKAYYKANPNVDPYNSFILYRSSIILPIIGGMSIAIK